jgi:hypothetical protein
MDSGGKQVHFVSFRKGFYLIASSNDVIASKTLTDLESAHQGLLFEVLHDIVPLI